MLYRGLAISRATSVRGACALVASLMLAPGATPGRRARPKHTMDIYTRMLNEEGYRAVLSVFLHNARFINLLASILLGPNRGLCKRDLRDAALVGKCRLATCRSQRMSVILGEK